MAKELVGSMAASPELIAQAVTAHLVENPVSADEPLLAAHLTDPTPHSAYDNLPAGVFVAYLQNGMA